jgi:hypothetical protein
MKRKTLIFAASLALLILVTGVVFAEDVPGYTYGPPLFGLEAAPDGSLLAANAEAGIIELRNGGSSVVNALPGVTDIAPIGRGSMFAITGGGEAGDPISNRLYSVSRGTSKVIADLGAFEAAVNPDGGEVDSNPYGVAVLDGGKALVADAGGNSLLIVDRQGNVDWVATLPSELVSTDNIKDLAGCDDTPLPGAEFVCFMPPMVEAEAVATSVAVGPDGAYYVSELKGFPAPTGVSKIWRIEPGTLHAHCGTDPACSVAVDGLISIVDLNFGPDGTLYAVELDEASWAAVEILQSPTGGTVDACDVSNGTCTEVATSLIVPTAVAVDKQGNLSAAVEGLLPSAHVITLP